MNTIRTQQQHKSISSVVIARTENSQTSRRNTVWQAGRQSVVEVCGAIRCNSAVGRMYMSKHTRILVLLLPHPSIDFCFCFPPGHAKCHRDVRFPKASVKSSSGLATTIYPARRRCACCVHLLYETPQLHPYPFLFNQAKLNYFDSGFRGHCELEYR